MNYWFTKPLLWHGKGFTLHWEIPDAKYVLVNFDNGERKPWYLRPARAYRFKRWFFRKNVASFSNIANIHFPQIRLYILHSYFRWPEIIVVPMKVSWLKVDEPEIILSQVHPYLMHNKITPIKTDLPRCTTKFVKISVMQNQVHTNHVLTKMGSVQQILEKDFSSYSKDQKTNKY